METFYRDHFQSFLQKNLKDNKALHKGHSPPKSQNEDPQTQSEIVFEDGNFQLFVEKSYFRRQKNFKTQDELFHLKVKQKGNPTNPLLINILHFLHAGILHILDTLKLFYEKGNYQICCKL